MEPTESQGRVIVRWEVYTCDPPMSRMGVITNCRGWCAKPMSPTAAAPAPLHQLIQDGRVLAGWSGARGVRWAQEGLGKRAGGRVPPSVKIFASCVNTHQGPSALQLFGIFSMSDAVWRRWVLSADRSPVRPRGGGRASLLGDSWRNHSPHCSVWGRSSSFWDLRSYYQVILSVKYSSYVWKEADMSISSKGSEPWSDFPGSCGKTWSSWLSACPPSTTGGLDFEECLKSQQMRIYYRPLVYLLLF